ncbi:hypothetical protein ABT234_25230 [Streptomyces sp. NPDC001586]|uniref:hypothetical protein n=1 Tax=Streptomyces sp. NPDC001586 TaxID=3154387 RepID=UPI003328BBE3
MRRWSLPLPLPLPLLLAALLAVPGCVTVHPTPTRPAEASPAAVEEDHKHPVDPRPAWPDAGPALPLSRMPAPAATSRAEAVPEAGRPPASARSTPAARAASGETQPARRASDRMAEDPSRPRRTTPPRPAVRPAAKPKKVKVRPRRTPAPHDPTRPAPGARAAHMAELCRAAHGVTSPAVAALCHQTYGR